ncbi:hypothetical protein [Streptomyces roseochromogenus]|uniref:Uncharacterized protein n=1 Tax=Streptomyces roseochromogenus subsp. oscitans DS 12.976 TaxID=1352936 RepID=V6KQI6_STRRC|nr:hypothetical protein [Streptomyces roseochromogenus]EST34283.1 hypothetical protein M878_11040 [Streptomyces roseochromogenus subsp. oscitans DS 12.976]
MRTAILFLTHTFDGETVHAFDKLAREAGVFGDVRILADSPTAPPDRLVHCSQSFDFEDLKAGYPRTLARDIVPGSCHLPVLDFARNHPYDDYWLIEYDVRFTGDWAVFFSATAGKPWKSIS